jgi:predicted transcriptional regulator
MKHEELKKRVRRSGIKQSHIASKYKVSQSYISQVLSGKKKPRKLIADLTSYLSKLNKHAA